MDYIGLLTKLIKESGLTHEEIIRRCEAYTEPYNYNYISTIKNRAKIPSDEFSRAVAKVCGRHEDLLVTQAYYDKSPKAFKDMIDSIVKIIRNISWVSFLAKSSEIDSAAKDIAKQKLDEMAVAEWLEEDLSDMAKQTDAIFEPLINTGVLDVLTSMVQTASEDENIFAYVAIDDSMSPAIPEGAEVHTILVSLEHLKDGDFICAKKDDTDEIYVRKIEFDDPREKMTLLPLNSKGYKTELFEISDNRLYEKVVQVIIDFE